MEKKHTARSAFSKLGILLGLLVFFAGVYMVLLARPNSQIVVREGARSSNEQLRRASNSSSIPAGGVYEAWVARYNGPASGYDEARAIAVDNSANVYVGGYSWGEGTRTDYTTIKYNAAGDQEWVARYDGAGNDDQLSALVVDGSGNVYVTGFSVINNNYRLECVTIKYDSAGQEQWVAHYRGPGDVAGGDAIAVDGSGNVYVAADASIPNDANNRFCVTIKYNASGQQEWVAQYDGGNNSNNPAAIVLHGGNNVYVAGGIRSCPAEDDLTLKYDSAGQEQWVTRYRGPGSGGDSANAIGVDASGNVYVTGDSWTSGVSSSTIKYNSAGQLQWVARYDQAAFNANALRIDGSSNVYVTGLVQDPNAHSDYGTIKYNSAGQQQWLARYNGPYGNGLDVANAIALDGTGNVYVTGRSAGPGIYGYPDYATIKYDSAGQQQWVARYNGTGDTDDEAVAIAVDNLGYVYVTGTSDGDLVTIKYGQGASPTPTVTPIRTPTPTPTPSPTGTPTPTPTPTPPGTPTPPQCFGQLYTILSESFDGVIPPALPAGWTATNAIDPDGILWQTSNSGLPSPPADSLPNAAWVNDPGAVSDKYLDSPSLFATESYFVWLTFRHNYNLESGFDGGVLEIRNFGGEFQDILAAGGYFIAGGYNSTIATGTGSPIAGRQAWSGNSGGFITTVVALPSELGNATLRWRMASDQSGASEGWRVDTMNIIWCHFSGTPSPSPTATPTPVQTCCQHLTTTGTGTIVRGTVDTGNHCDNCLTLISFPFPVQFYGSTITQAYINSNGSLQLTGDVAHFGNSCPLPDYCQDAAILVYQDDLRTDGPGNGVFTSVSGRTPNRVLNIEWRTSYFGRSGSANFELRFYENQASFDMVYGANTENGASAESGVQQSTLPGPCDSTTFSCHTPSLISGLKVTYQPWPCHVPTPTPTATASVSVTPTPPITPTPTPTSTPTPCRERCNPTPRPRPTPAPRP